MSSNDPAKPRLLKPAANIGAVPPTSSLGEATVRTEPKPSAWDGAPPEQWIGRTLGKYEITSVLGKGGMGVVFKARDPLIQRDVAVKVLAPALSVDAKALARFLAEARAAGKLNHPNVVAIHDISHENDIYYLVMEVVPGGSLGERLEASGPLSVLMANKAMVDTCRGVGAAHAAGMVHRDIKPANLMCAADGSIKVMDFGLAKSLTDSVGQTQTGVTLGTPFFMSPEQCQAKPVDARSDVYSLGATYYALLTGKYPYQNAGTQMQVLYQHCNGPIPDPRDINPAIPAACSLIIARAMAKDPGDRYATASEMLLDLQAMSAPFAARPAAIVTAPAAPPPEPPRSSGRIGFAVAGVFLCALIVGVAAWKPWLLLGPSNSTPIKIGILHSLTGTMAADETSVLDATRLALDEINDAGGLLGRPLEYTIADGRSDEVVFAAQAQKLIADDKVKALFGCWTSASRKAIKPIVEAHDHLLMYPVQYEGLETSPNIVYLGAVPNQQILPALEWAVNTLGRKRFFLVGSDYVFPHAANEIIKDHLKTLKAEIAGAAYVRLGSHEMGEVLDEIEKAKPDMILNTINGDSNIAFFRSLRLRHKSTDMPVMSFSVSEQQLRSLAAADVQGDYAAWSYFQAIPGPDNEQFIKRYNAKHPERRITDPMHSAYFGVKLWAQAVAKAKSVEPKLVREALRDARLSTPAGEIRIDAQNLHCYQTPRIGRVHADGNFGILWTASAPIAPQPYPATRTPEGWRLFLGELQAGWNGRWSAPQ